MAGAGSPVVCRVADAAGKTDKLFRFRRRKHKVLGVSSDHAQSVNQDTGEDVGFPEILSIGARDQPRFDQRGECLQRIRRAQARVVVSMHHLQVLYGIFDVDQTSYTILQVDLSRLYQLSKLLSPDLQRCGNVPGGFSIDEGISVRFHLSAQ